MEEIIYITEKNVAPAGIHNGVCVGVYNLYLQPGYQGGEPKNEMFIIFEIDKMMESGEYSSKPYRLSKRQSINLHEKSTLYKTLKSWFGKDPTTGTGNKKRFNPAALVGKPCSLVVSQYESNGETKAKIDSVLPHDPNKPVLTTEFDASVTPDWIKKIQAQRLDKAANATVTPEISPSQGGKSKPGDDNWLDQ